MLVAARILVERHAPIEARMLVAEFCTLGELRKDLGADVLADSNTSQVCAQPHRTLVTLDHPCLTFDFRLGRTGKEN